MNIKNILLSCMMLTSLAASAQDQEPKTVYEFQPHWNVFVQPVGAQYTLGETCFGDLVSYNVQAGGGYQFTPIFGARLAINAWQSKAAWDFEGAKQEWKWNYVAPMVDATVDLTNLLFGYKPERLVSFGVFAGIGANIGWGNDEAAVAKSNIDNYYNVPNYSTENLSHLWDGTKVRFAGHAGVNVDFRICDMVSAGLEVQATTLSDNYNSKDAGNSDWYFNALAGVKINLGKTYTKKVVPPAPERVVEKVVEKIVEKIVEKPVVQEVVKVEPFRRDIFFAISSTKITPTEMVKVAEISNFLKENPKANVMITGYADKGTGSAKINKSLSEKRAAAVVTALKTKYGIAESRIKSDSKGDTEQPYTEQILNRVSICIAE